MATTLKSVTLALEPERGPVDITWDGQQIISVQPANEDAIEQGIDGRGKYLLPGLIDTHLHLTGTKNLEDLIRAGVTTGVDLGTHPDSLVQELRDVPGVASIISAGSAASAPGGTQTEVMGFPAESIVHGPEDAERFIQWRIDNNSDLIKIIIEDPHNPTVSALSLDTLRALVTSAHDHGLLTVAHAVTDYSFTLGIEAGVDILTHSPADKPLSTENVQKIAERGIIVSPTLIMMKTVIASREGQPGPVLDYQACQESVRALHHGGAVLLAGTDANETPMAPVPHGTSLHDELDLLIEAGLNNREAIISATTDAARYLRLSDRGLIEEGLRADLLLVDANPLEDISTLRRPFAVWAAGQQANLK
ncbi:MAG: amidohydrolase family protein [Rothia sp. (in: high G+C Gram-positive bacteria)]|nr:amidohydrolase family protein [Rothia sp. (in: high G+C Gram-positive bacteria)]